MKTLICLLLTLSTALDAKSKLPTEISRNNQTFQQCDRFTFKYGFVIKVFEIAWYSPQCQSQSLLESNNKILRFYYFKNVKADFFKQSAEEFFIKNLEPYQRQDQLIAALKAFNQGYEPIKPGDYFQLEHFNTSQISLFKNNDLLASADNADLAKNYFNIWFGQEPAIARLKEAFSK